MDLSRFDSICAVTLRICQGANPPFIRFLARVSGFFMDCRMAAARRKHSSAESRSPWSVLLNAVSNSSIINRNCAGESSGSLLASGKTDVGLVFRAVSSTPAAIGAGVIKVVPRPALLETEPF
ncbi:MAG: hypothetical protein ACREVN_13585 [Gammaproteobacteria bacterium]